MRTSRDLIGYMERNAIPGELIALPVHTPSVESAARAVGTSPDRIVKSLMFLVQGRAIMAVTSGMARVDERAIATHFDVDPSQVKLADAAAVQQITGYPVGAVPPFGHTQPIPTLIDRHVTAQEEVYAGGGELDALLRIRPAEIVRATQAQELDLRLERGSAGG
jgi:prolyl-tRNA editing enzyme YbaK/EbsC (Cys-tRNA(Pro) deacylase)